MPVSPQFEFPFPSLDFPERSFVYVHEAAERLQVSEQHIINLGVAGELNIVDIGVRAKGRGWYRIPIESWHAFILSRMTCPPADNPILQLPTPTLKKHVIDCLVRLSVRGVPLLGWLRDVLDEHRI